MSAFDLLDPVLVDEGLVTKDQMAIAKESQKNLGEPLEQVLMERGFVTEQQLLKALSKKIKTPFVSLGRFKLDPAVVKLIPAKLAKKYRAIPLFKIENKITIATSNPLDLLALDDLQATLGCNIEAMLTLDSDIERVIKEYYRGDGLTTSQQTAKVEIITADIDLPTEIQAEKLEKEASGKDIINSVNNIICQAVDERASDIHIEPAREKVTVRFRLDGVLEDFTTLPKAMHLPIISRIKIMGSMDVAESRVPQDGRVRLRLNEKEVDVRIATYPTMFGEASAIRLLSKDQLITLENLGFYQEDLVKFQELIVKPHGILLVTGPTGSGKTTTLYAALSRINTRDKHILSIEDPIENEIEGVDQQQVNVKAGMTFAAALRAMLRQDPDVIMVGEIRDLETADIAMRAAMTGHFVFSSLHTNNAVGAITRLIDLGIEPFLISSSLVGVMAQRLVRKICLYCKEEITPDEKKLKQLAPKKPFEKIFAGKGCKHCRQTGYSGRVGLFEILQVNEELINLIGKKASESEIREMAMAHGHKGLVDDGIEKIRQGQTTLDEVMRVTALL
ncbi:GspE/PulE family protein [bacterium]|nr:GspE/PulE family protein [bacterium]MBU1918601.1 GspE/PulE family protein [bacterium]